MLYSRISRPLIQPAMQKIAIDIVLLPPEEVVEKATEINQTLETQEIDFKEDDIYPHITLLMGCLEEQKVPQVESLLRELAQASGAMPLQISGIKAEGSVSFEVEKTGNLQGLHEKLIQKLTPFLSYDATEEMFYRPEEVKENAINYVNRFLHEASHDRFWPHLTLGYGDYADEKLKLPFTASRLALCQLGKHCTCRNILHEEKLK